MSTRYLIDTHILLWDLSADSRLSASHAALMSGDAPKFVSVASLWEISIKVSLGKLTVPPRLLSIIEDSDVEILPILPQHAMHTSALPLHHRDPFDRLLIAQAQIEGLTIVTADPAFARYDVVCV
ncbi:PIN domain-containing protein [Mesorhizobium sp. NBSH29]|uniref:type II toxin-antitoxin system VapC family toxin n=1 Tax=Mesorhizobium sp. NBSH29 TaxID=2654249 RepID=UPI0018964586|nr:type II toxin-antitoxin system VapC family toxin [Mesorhizobium sp. NBSH29]QPC86885.1 PIN domain-containing protein [Mesorhizobium sp. NBSH29]